ncbi:hypothetical protein [Streptomyces sp. MMBL 11-1]|uniref:hypothetical protein n=1 Tax=Streptomyces sp. MMBL 11-1 TaxID=3026420 RepID=UPI002361E231|nr:hypothetical protein [Streptomyces sp. MMBL 11-1]
MATGKRTVSLGILGVAEVPTSLVVDALNDHLAMGPEDAEGYFGPSDRYELNLLIPAGEHATSQGVHRVWEWGIRCELPYRVLWDETGNDFTDDVLANVDNPEQDIVIAGDLGKAMVEHLGQAENPLLLLLSTDGQFDEATASAAAAALRESIPCHDLSRALLEVGWQHLPGHEPPQESALEVEADGQTALSVVSDAPDVTLTATEAATVSQSLAEAEAFVGDLTNDLVSRAESLRQTLIHGRSLLAPSKPQDQEADDEKPKKTRLEIFNSETGEWEPAGRGRPPAGVQKRRVPA